MRDSGLKKWAGPQPASGGRLLATGLKSLLSLLCLGALYSNSLLADSSKIAPELAAGGSGQAKVIVVYTKPPSAATLLSNSLLGAILTKTLSSLNAAIMTIPVSSIVALSQNPEVVYIAPDRPLTQLVDYSVAAVNAGVAQQAGLTGAGIGIAVIDSGIAEAPDLSLLGASTKLLAGVSRVVYHENIANGSVKDGFGHGSHVAGIIAGSGASAQCLNCTRRLSGMAPNANLVDLQVLDSQGQGSDSLVITAIDRAIQLKSTFNIRVINLSLGRPIYESYTKDPLCRAVEAAWKAGIVVVVAAGNSGRDNSVGNNGYGTIQSPANDPYVITVGAMKAMNTYDRSDDLIASYSSKGPSAIDFVTKPDLVAPGNHVVSIEAPGSLLASEAANAVPLSYYQATTSSTTSANYMMLNGTSMATPVVSGAVADLLQGQPSLTPDQVKARLMTTAYKHFPTSSTAVDLVTGQAFTSTYDMFTVGAGYLDVAAALANHDLASGTALSPLAHYNPVSAKVYLVFDPTSTWQGTTGPWAAQTVWGSTNVGPDQAIWNMQSVWGGSTVFGFKAIWGTRGVWGTETDAGTATVGGTRAVWGTSSSTSDSDTVFTVHQ